MLCRAIDGDSPAIRAPLAATNEMAVPQEQPLIGEGFAAIAVGSARDSDSNLHVFDFATGSERRVRLPGVQVTGMRPHGQRVVLESTDGIILLGERGTPLR